MRKEQKKKKEIMCYTADAYLKAAIQEIADERGSTKAEIQRIAMKKFVKDGQDDAIVMLHTVVLQQELNDIKDSIPKERYERIQKCMETIMKVKGATSDGRI